MSEPDKSHTSVLLPGARVTLFTRDAETRQTFLSIKEDWRFARVVLEVIEGDVTTATELYASTPSADLVIVQTDNINDGFTQKIEGLGGVCAEGTAAIIIGPVNDVNLYRRLVGMGISDYLVKPLKKEQLANDIAATLIKRIGATGSRLVVFMGAKGGVGTTVLAEGLAWAVSEKLNQKTFLLDGSGGWSTLSVGMEFEPATTLAEATRAAAEGNLDSLTRMLANPSDKLCVLSSGGDVMLDDATAPENFEALIDHFMTSYPVVIVDLSASPAALRRVALVKASKIFLVTSPLLSSVRATRTLLKEIKDLRGGAQQDAVDIILNMKGFDSKNEVNKAQIEQGLERKISAVIPFAPDVFVRTESEAKKLHEHKDAFEVVERLLTLVRKVLADTGSESMMAEPEEKKGGLSGILTKLKAGKS